jgi:RNA polymerase sigma factor (sigma-70 family)
MAPVDVHGLVPLLQRVLGGEGRAFNELLAQLRPYIHRQVRDRLGVDGQGRIDQSALVQSVCRRVVVHFPDLKGLTVPSLLGWIRRIAENRVNDELRRLAHDPLRPVGSDIQFLAQPGPEADSLDRAQLAAEVARALAQLPERERRVVETRWFDRQPDEATAAELGVTVNHVHQLRFRALEKLRRLLGHLEGEVP